MSNSTQIGAAVKAIATALFAASMLTACNFSTDSTPKAASLQVSPSSVVGRVVADETIANANVTVTDVNGRSYSVTSDAAGNFSLPLNGMKAPLVIAATDPSGASPTLFSVVATIPVGTAAPVVANVTKLSTALASLLTDSGNPADLAYSGNLSELVSATRLDAAVARLDGSLSKLVDSGAGTTAPEGAPEGQATPVSITGTDSQATDGTTATTNSGNTIGAPVSPTTLLSSLNARLASCLSGVSTNCTQVIAGDYLEDGYTNFAAAHPTLVSRGVSISSLQTVQLFNVNGGQRALIQINWTTADGHTGSDTTVVAYDATSWMVVGNQHG